MKLEIEITKQMHGWELSIRDGLFTSTNALPHSDKLIPQISRIIAKQIRLD